MKLIINGETVEAGGASLPPGGTTGQALVKASNADADVEWGDVIGSQCITEIKVVTSAEYNALTTKNDTTLYVIKE